MKSFIRMKYEQFMMRLFDWIVEKFRNNERLKWYVSYSLGYDEEIKKWEDVAQELEYQLEDYRERVWAQEETIQELKDFLDYYQKTANILYDIDEVKESM